MKKKTLAVCLVLALVSPNVFAKEINLECKTKRVEGNEFVWDLYLDLDKNSGTKTSRVHDEFTAGKLIVTADTYVLRTANDIYVENTVLSRVDLSVREDLEFSDQFSSIPDKKFYGSCKVVENPKVKI